VREGRGEGEMERKRERGKERWGEGVKGRRGERERG
jgi:hypothetical protein